MQTDVSRLDILLYAHDGRGLGHVSRSAAIGMALRRLFPELSVLLVTGAAATQELIGDRGLDWLKLPSYATEVMAGVSRGVAGPSGFDDSELGELRARQLHQVVDLYRPRLVLADHTPQGKHRELIPALQHSSEKSGGQTRWLLGVRGVVGGVAQVGSQTARATFNDHYHDLFWYGDSGVLGPAHLQWLRDFYQVAPYECGYVARLREVMAEAPAAISPGPAATVSIPWLGEHTAHFLEQLAQAIRNLGGGYGGWNIFCESKGQRFFKDIPHCQTLPFSGSGYVQSLAASRVAMIFGGYNSIIDVLSLGVPTVVVLREMADNEQQLHLEHLHKAAGTGLDSFDESQATTAVLLDTLKRKLQLSNRRPSSSSRVAGAVSVQPQAVINLTGAENAARRLTQLVLERSHQ